MKISNINMDNNSMPRYKGRKILEHTMYNNVIGFLLLSFYGFLGMLFATGMIRATMKTGDVPWLIAGWFLFIFSAILFCTTVVGATKLRKIKIYENGVLYPLPIYKNIQYRKKYKDPGIFYYFDEIEYIKKIKKWNIEIKLSNDIRTLRFRQKTRDKIYDILNNTRKRYFERKEQRKSMKA